MREKALWQTTCARFAQSREKSLSFNAEKFASDIPAKCGDLAISDT
jgi:hypothetical protein